MKTNSIKNIFALALILLTAMGCGRYEEGPCISFRSVLDRIEGEYIVVYLSKNNVDITQNWKDSCNWTFSFIDYEDTHHNEQQLTYGGSCFYNDSLINIYDDDYYYFNEDKTKLYMCLVNYCWLGDYSGLHNEPVGMYPLMTGAVRVFNVEKLTLTELWLSFDSEFGEQYFIKMEEV